MSHFSHRFNVMETRLLANEAPPVAVPKVGVPGPVEVPGPAAGGALERLGALSGGGSGIGTSLKRGRETWTAPKGRVDKTPRADPGPVSREAPSSGISTMLEFSTPGGWIVFWFSETGCWSFIVRQFR
jgi:hypothetical protein